LATVAEKFCVWPNWSVAEAGVTPTEIEAWGAGGGSLPAAGEWVLELPKEAQPPMRKMAHRQVTIMGMGAQTTVGTPGSEFKGPILQLSSLGERQF
jgi:hypothetical protein